MSAAVEIRRHGAEVLDELEPLWLTLKIASGSVTLKGGSSLSGVVIAPTGAVEIAGNSKLTGSVFCDKLTINSNGILQGIAKRVVDGTASSTQARTAAAGARPLAEMGWRIAQQGT